MKLLITGGCGFLGSNLADRALEQEDTLLIFDNLHRTGSVANLDWLKKRGEFRFEFGDIRNPHEILRIVSDFSPDAVFHLAGQVAMTTSIADPRTDFEVNALGTLNLLESVRQCVPHAPILYSSTNKAYGNLEQYSYRETATRYECLEKPNGFDEDTPLDFHSPYGCSKGAADQYMLDYARVFDLKTVVFRHSSMYGGRQFATYDQGWVGWFCQKAVEAREGRLSHPFTISGNGKQVRDVLHADDMIRLYYTTLENITTARGQAFNIGGGMANSLSLLELFSLLEEITGAKLTYTKLPPRSSDQKVFVADLLKARTLLHWTPQVSAKDGIIRMLDWVSSQLHV